jgi:DNA-binding response OmpR family regulator
MKIMILEDEKSLADSMADFLEELGYTVDIFGDSNQAVEAIYESSYDLLLLDVKVHGQNGFEMLKELRVEGCKIPAIFVTSLTDIKDLSQGYESGCCDYIRKPFELEELKLRVDSVMKNRYDLLDDKFVQLPLDFRYDMKKFKLFREEKEISLTKTEIKIIELLIKNRGKVVTIDQFSDEVWSHNVLEANIRVQINQLRKKSDKDLIKNIRGIGYTIDT